MSTFPLINVDTTYESHGFVWDTNTLSWVEDTGSPSSAALTASSPTAATVGASSAQALASNSTRKGLVLVNTSANTISLAFGATAVLNSGITLDPGASFTMTTNTLSTAAVNAIASAASSNLAIQEFTS